MGNENNKVGMYSLKESLLKEGINPSFQRLKIYEYVMNTKSHPTVEKIFNDLSSEIPTLSKTTIYNTLNLYQEKNIVSGLTIEGKEVRYDGNVKPHAHFKCNACGGLYDIEVDIPSLTGDQDASRSQYEKDNRPQIICGHSVTEIHFYLKGTCASCLGQLPQS